MSQSRMKGLPQPYNMKPRSNSKLTTPQKKLLFYVLALVSIGLIIYWSTAGQEKETEVALDTEKSIGSGMKRVLDEPMPLL